MSALQADLLILLINFISASSYLVSKSAMAGAAVPPITFVALRFLVASAALLLFWPSRVRRIGKGGLTYGGIIGVLCACGLILLNLALPHVETGAAAFLVSLCSALIPLLDRIFYGEPIRRTAMAGIAAAAVGVYLLTGAGELRFGIPEALILGATFFFALHTVLNARFSQKAGAVDIGIVQILVCTAVAIAAAPLAEPWAVPSGADFWAALLYLGVAATAVRFVIQVYAQSFTTPTRAGVMFMLEPILASLYGWYFAGEVLVRQQQLGCALIFIGTIIAQIGPWLGGRRVQQETIS
jgi:drug/metabolite transporter (DMT)-like permease